MPFEEMLTKNLPTVEEQVSLLLLWIGDGLDAPNGSTWLEPLEVSAVIGTVDNGGGLDYIINALRKRGFLSGEDKPLQREGGVFQHYVGLTPEGWNAYHKLKERKSDQPATSPPPSGSTYVSQVRLEELRAVKSTDFDLAKLIRLCEELNSNFSNSNYCSTGILVWAILDHIPPVFSATSFSQVCANHGGKSFKQAMDYLDKSSRKIGDGFLHGQMTRREALPTDASIQFGPALDLLLGEIAAKLR
jgi:hypothetical protein